MELQQLAQFKQPPTQQTKTSYLSQKTTSPKMQKIKITCAQFTTQNQSLTCGLNDGTIIQFVNQKYSNKKLTESKEYEVRKFNTLEHIHKGEIRCLIVEKIFNQFFVITGSADRTVKIWDTQLKSKSVVQTLTGHTGTIMCLTYSKKSDTLFSGSVDKTIRIWKQDESRKYFMYPWYISYQILSDFSPKKQLDDQPTYPTAFQLLDGQVNSFILYIGDSIGNLHIVKQYQIQGVIGDLQGKNRTGFQIDKSNFKHHRLSINCIKYVNKEHLVVSCGYDQFLYGFQSLSEKLTLKFANPKKCLFTSIISIQNLLIVADQSGSFYCLELSSDKPIEEIKKYDCKINQIFMKNGQIFTVTDERIDVYKIVRGIKTVQGENCHKDSIIGIFALEASRLTDKKIKDQVKIVSVSLDNTMRVWDPNDLSCLEVMPNPQKAQISSLFYLKRANLFVTGHQNGMVRLWNIQLQTSITITQNNSPYAHNSNVCVFNQYIHVRGNEDITEYMFSTGYEGKINVWEIFLKKSSVQSSLISSSICPQLKNSFFPQQQQQGQDKIGFQLFALEILSNKSVQQQDAIILSAGTKGIVYFSKMFTYQTLHKYKLHTDTILCMMLDQNILFTGSCDQTIRLTNLENVDHIENLTILRAHEASIVYLSLLQQTGHLITQASDGQILFWDYTSQKIVKKIKQKKQKIGCICYIDQSHMMYVGTQSAKILTYDLDQLYSEKVNNKFNFKYKNVDQLSEESLEVMMKRNQQEIQNLMKDM